LLLGRKRRSGAPNKFTATGRGKAARRSPGGAASAPPLLVRRITAMKATVSFPLAADEGVPSDLRRSLKQQSAAV
jgi:hypothetical protein